MKIHYPNETNAELAYQRDLIAARVRHLEGTVNALREAFAIHRRRYIIDLASTSHPDYGDKIPKELWPWRTLHFQKRRRKRRQREQYLAVLNSPLFDAEYYLTKYPDVAERGEDPILHYLSRGSDEGRWPSAAVDPTECLRFFPELAESEGNLVLRLIALLGPVWDET